MENRKRWWELEENNLNVKLPICVLKLEDGTWLAATNGQTEEYLGESIRSCAQSESKEEAINELFRLIRLLNRYEKSCMLKYKRWVPFMKGDWSKKGGTWFCIFGFNFYFRYTNSASGGWYLPFTKLNILISSQWRAYREYMRKNPPPIARSF